MIALPSKNVFVVDIVVAGFVVGFSVVVVVVSVGNFVVVDVGSVFVGSFVDVVENIDSRLALEFQCVWVVVVWFCVTALLAALNFLYFVVIILWRCKVDQWLYVAILWRCEVDQWLYVAVLWRCEVDQWLYVAVLWCCVALLSTDFSPPSSFFPPSPPLSGT